MKLASVVAGLVLATLALGSATACDGPGPRVAASAPPSAAVSVQPSVTEPVVTGSAPAVPGGAAVTVAAGAPAICRTLAQSSHLRNLATALARLDDPTTHAEGVADLQATALFLRTQATSAGTLGAPMTTLADAIDAVAAAGDTGASTTDVLSQRLTGLGSEAQTECGFPVG